MTAKPTTKPRKPKAPKAPLTIGDVFQVKPHKGPLGRTYALYARGKHPEDWTQVSGTFLNEGPAYDLAGRLFDALKGRLS